MRVLCLSNGHGEDGIAVQILQALQTHPQVEHIAALPLVGEGQAYRIRQIPIVGPVQAMPSGGFVYMDGRELAKDVRGGLVQLTLKQLRAIKAWAKDSGKGDGGDRAVLAVGDIVPLAFAWWSGLPYGFVGTARSEYYLRDEVGWLRRKTRWERLENWSGCVFSPVDRWFMARSRCRAVFPRDALTTQILQQKGINRAWNLGNPMMDGLDPDALDPNTLNPDALDRASWGPWHNCLKVLLLPGSRPQEAQRNWQKILQAADWVAKAEIGRKTLFLTALSPHLDLDLFLPEVTRQGWRPAIDPIKPIPADARAFSRTNHGLQISQTAFPLYAQMADVAVAMTGTATEQFVGLGKPVVSLVGTGPQFTPAFAEAQTRLLGTSVTLARYPSEVGQRIKKILSDPDRLQLIAQNGHRRMGQPGAGQRIADQWLKSLAP